MKIRIKFAKTGVMKFVGHLDVMRYFQKAIRRAELPIAYSEGFSPHMLLSFASPLGVGISSTGEYFDMVLAEDMKTDEIVKRLNATMVEGMEVISARHVPDGKASKAMSLVAGADYLVQFREGKMPEIDLETKVPEFFALPQIEIMRKTKRSEKLTDIRPWIYDMKVKKSGKFRGVHLHPQGTQHNGYSSLLPCQAHFSYDRSDGSHWLQRRYPLLPSRLLSEIHSRS